MFDVSDHSTVHTLDKFNHATNTWLTNPWL